MRRILIATHEKYAEGITAAAELILGPHPEIETICAFTEDIALDRQLEIYFKHCNAEDEVIILTDVYGGSVNQACMNYVSRPNTHLITGMNLALVLQIIMMEEKEGSEAFGAMIEEARMQIVYVNEVMKGGIKDDFED